MNDEEKARKLLCTATLPTYTAAILSNRQNIAHIYDKCGK